jgi:hypothetical protein
MGLEAKLPVQVQRWFPVPRIEVAGLAEAVDVDVDVDVEGRRRE